MATFQTDRNTAFEVLRDHARSCSGAPNLALICAGFGTDASRF
jgi:hypothetical protein